jgi:antitoxin HigA-1
MPMKNPPHPGRLLRDEVVDSLGITVTQAAERLGVSRVALSRVLNERSSVSADLAIRLEQAGVGTARFWLNLQLNFDLSVIRVRPPLPVRSLRAAA